MVKTAFITERVNKTTVWSKSAPSTHNIADTIVSKVGIPESWSTKQITPAKRLYNIQASDDVKMRKRLIKNNIKSA